MTDGLGGRGMQSLATPERVPTSSAQRRRYIRDAVILSVAACALASCRARGVPRPVPPAIDAASAAVVATADSLAVRRALLRSIRQFQSAWRLAWQRSEVSRHGAIQLALVREDISMGINSPEVRRFRAIRCSAGFTNDGALAMEQTNAPTGDFRNDTRTNRAAVVERMRDGARTMEEISQQAQRAERSARDKSTVCAMWTPEHDYLPLDEGDDPDLALMTSLRPRLRRDRDTLLARLRVAARRFPADSWIAGQRVRFALDQHDTAQAAQAAAQCSGDGVWCAALQAVVHERRGVLAEADSAFTRVVQLRRAQTSGDCSDSLLLFVLDDASRQRLNNLACLPRRAVIDTMWWLADPLWSDAGNDRFVAHHTRETWIRLRAAATEDERFTWRTEGGGEALRATIMRYGWPSHAYWGGRFLDEEISQLRERVRMEANPPYLAHEYSRGRSAFIPDASLLADPFASEPEAWASQHGPASRADQWWPREHMRHPRGVVPMPRGQLALLRRDSTVLVAIAIDAPAPQSAPDPLDRSRATLLASMGPRDTQTLQQRTSSPDSTLRLSGLARARPFALSVELAPRVLHEPWHRLRQGVRPPPSLSEMRDGDVAASDPIILGGATSSREVVTTAEALVRMLGTERVSRSVPMGVYWETYGFAPGDTLDIVVQLVRNEQPGGVRQLGAALGLSRARRDSVSVRWREPDARYVSALLTAVRPTVARAITLDLRAVPPGAYIVRTEVRHNDGRRATNSRSLVIE